MIHIPGTLVRITCSLHLPFGRQIKKQQEARVLESPDADGMVFLAVKSQEPQLHPFLDTYFCCRIHSAFIEERCSPTFLRGALTQPEFTGQDPKQFGDLRLVWRDE
jgi:hypothetical protein